MSNELAADSAELRKARGAFFTPAGGDSLRLRAGDHVIDRYSRIFALDHVRPAVVADLLGECQARFPSVPIVFAETRQLAQEWAYRFLAASRHELGLNSVTEERPTGLSGAEPATPLPPKPAVVRSWARENGIEVSDRGRLRPEVVPKEGIPFSNLENLGVSAHGRAMSR